MMQLTFKRYEIKYQLTEEQCTRLMQAMAPYMVPDEWGASTVCTVYYDTPSPEETGYYQAMYRAHWMGRNADWGKWEYDDDDGGAGNDRDQLDMVEVTIVRC